MIDLYFWTTDNGHKARQGLEESGLDYTIKLVNLLNKEQFDPAFLKISPGHKIPALVDPEGPGGPLTLFESGAILKYVGEKSEQWPLSERSGASRRGGPMVILWIRNLYNFSATVWVFSFTVSERGAGCQIPLFDHHARYVCYPGHEIGGN